MMMMSGPVLCGIGSLVVVDRVGDRLRARRTEHTNKVYKLPGGTEDSDLWTYLVEVEGSDHKAICSVWVPTEKERLAIASGMNIRLVIFAGKQPPVAVDLTDEKIMGVDRH